MADRLQDLDKATGEVVDLHHLPVDVDEEGHVLAHGMNQAVEGLPSARAPIYRFF
jgi:hypothetical protein